MTDLNQAGGFSMPVDKPTLPGGLKTLTTLTIIGCAVFFCLSVYTFATAKEGLEKMETMMNSPEFDKMPGFVKSMMTPEGLEYKRKQYENRLPIVIIEVVGLALCFVGAMQMRKLRAQGYYLYIVGEVLPFVGTIIFVGAGVLKGFVGGIIIAIILLFIILYTMQRKYLVNK